MNEENSRNETPEDAEPGPGERRRWPRRIIVLLVVVVLVAAAVAGYVRMTGPAPSQGEASREARLESRIAELQERLARLRSDWGGLASRIQEIEESQARNMQSIQGLRALRADSNLDWALAEIEYLLVIATHRLELAHDAGTALAAVDAAATRLERLDYPGLDAVREQLAADRAALRSVEDVDITGLVLYLSDLIGGVDTMPLREAEPAPDDAETAAGPAAPEPGVRALLRAIWAELKDLVRVRRAGSAAPVLLPPEQRYFLVQNLRLQLETARLAALRRDSALFHSSLAGALEWMETYFDTGDGETANIAGALREMSELELMPELPDIASSLESVRALARTRASAADAEP